MQSDEQIPQQENAFTVSGYGGLSCVFTAEELQEAVRTQLLEDTTFRIIVYRTSYSDTRTGEGIYRVVDGKTILVEEFGVCIGLAEKMLPEWSLIPQPPSTILHFPDKADRSQTRKATQDVSPPRDDMEEERRCRLLKAFPMLGDYRIIVIFVDLLDECIRDLQHEETPVTAAAMAGRTHFTLELCEGYLALLAEQSRRTHMEKHS